MAEKDRAIPTKQLTATISGRVQGVNFRYYTAQTAARLGCVGYVKNVADGTVHVVAEGTEQQLTALMTFLRRGSPASTVLNVETHWSDASGSFDTFMIRH